MSGLRPLLLVLPALWLGQAAGALAQAPLTSPPQVSGTTTDATPSKSAETAQQALSLATLQDEALARLKAAADAGDMGAAMSLARYYAGSDASDDDTAQMVAYLQKAADAGVVEALVWLGDVYHTGLEPIAADPAKAKDFYQKASDLGDDHARLMLADILLGGGIADQAKARTLLQAASGNGNIEAATRLAGLLLADGDGKGATDLLSRGVLIGDGAALVALADIYAGGLGGVETARDKAILLYYSASRQGDMVAARKLAALYLEGEGEVVNLNGAVALLEQIAASGDVTALLDLGDLFVKGEKAPIDARRAAEYYEQASEKGNLEALLRLGNLYRFGVEGMKPSPTKAIPYFEEAADFGDNTARKSLAQMLIAGEGFAPDVARAKELLEDAVADGDAEAKAMLDALDAPPPLPQPQTPA